MCDTGSVGEGGEGVNRQTHRQTGRGVGLGKDGRDSRRWGGGVVGVQEVRGECMGPRGGGITVKGSSVYRSHSCLA